MNYYKKYKGEGLIVGWKENFPYFIIPLSKKA
jgi:hypothetical protein